jgi:hypothetical protein
MSFIIWHQSGNPGGGRPRARGRYGGGAARAIMIQLVVSKRDFLSQEEKKSWFIVRVHATQAGRKKERETVSGKRKKLFKD